MARARTCHGPANQLSRSRKASRTNRMTAKWAQGPCTRCGYEWKSKLKSPQWCPRCKSKEWRTAKVRNFGQVSRRYWKPAEQGRNGQPTTRGRMLRKGGRRKAGARQAARRQATVLETGLTL